MTATTIALGSSPMSEVEHQSALRRAVIASTVGTTIEWYDFLIYSTVTGLVFNKVYFPGSDPWVGTLQAFGVYFVGFVARPIGAAIFGHYGDRIGRKATLIVTLLMTGIATAAVGLVPGYDQIGIWGAVILVILRLIQGIGVGGEWGGSVLLAMEWAQTNKNRGFITSWPQFGAPLGLFLANVAVLFFSWYSGDQFLNWGWRIPFLISIIMVAVGLWIRLGILETPVFQRILAENKVERAPIIEVLKRQPREVILCALLRMAEQTPGYIFSAFVVTYGTLVLGASRNLLLTGLVAMTALGFVTVPIAGALSDRIGRRKVYIGGCIFVAVFTFGYFALLDTRVPELIFLAVALSFIPVMTMYGAEAALIAEAFTPRLRYSGASLGYQLASIIAGGPAPFISAWLFSTYHSAFPIGLYVCVCAAISICAALLLPDQTNKDIAHEAHYGNA
jgi:metabolite-proton symporter